MAENPATMPPKKPRRTAERILEVTLELFNRFGEPNVSTTLISAELNISPGNLYYHYPAKDELINALFGRYEKALDELLRAADGVRNVEDAWLFFHMLFELIWQYRFLYRDLNDLLSKNRRLETHFQFVLKNKGSAVQSVLAGLARGGAMKIEPRDMEPVATAMVAGLPEVTVHFSRFRVTEIALSQQALAQFDDSEILRAAELLAHAKVHCIAWNGTSAGWLGFERDVRLCERITAATGIPAGPACPRAERRCRPGRRGQRS